MRVIDADKLIELIDDDITLLNDDISSLDFVGMSREGYDVCLCTLQMVKLYIEALPTVPLDWKSIMDDWTEHDNAMIAKGREIERRLNAPKHGHWIDRGSGQECSECGEMQYGYDSYRNYCACCGADMREVEE